MIKKLLITFFIISFLSGGIVFAHDDEGHEAVFVRITNEGFSPEEITIKNGDTVIFENSSGIKPWPASNIHPTHRSYPGSDIELCGTEEESELFDSCRGLEEGESYEFTFSNSGEWRYHDHNNPKFKGKITVLDSLGEDPVQEELGLAKRIWNSVKSFFVKIFSSDGSNNANSLTGAFKEEIKEFEESYDSSIDEDSTEVFNDKQALFSYVKKYGAGQTTKHLHDLEYNQNFGFCHNNAHDVGRFAYALGGGQAFQECSAECHSGCYHGATEAYFRDRGLSNLVEDLDLLCNEDLNSFFSHQCVHGIGHGLMAWTDYDIHEALSGCDDLPEGQSSCYSGVFMENVVGGLAEEDGHFTEYLSDDPHMPCNVVDEKYVNDCYYYQTSRMVSIFGGDFSKVAEACSEIDEIYQGSCFASMGRDVGGANFTNNKRAVEECDHAPEGFPRIQCIGGAAQNTFWVSQGQDSAIEFCSLVNTGAEKDYCYTTIFSRATQVIEGDAEFRSFCLKTEESYKDMCLGYL